MALNAKFYADFTSFYAAVQKAEGHLKGFEADADKTGKALDKMVDQFSGRKVLEQATLMTKAVADVGGAAMLTDANLRKVSATVAEATQQLERMGKDVPKEFQDITKAAEGVAEPTESWASSLNLVKGGIAAVVSSGLVKYLYDSAQAGIAWAGALSRMHAQTDISYRDLQVLQDVAIATATDMSSLTRAVMVLQERIGDRSAREGIQRLGLSFDAILAMDPAEQFITISKALAKITDEEKRAALAKQILGNAYREVLPAMRANWAEIEKNTKIVSGEQIEAVDRLSARWAKFWNDQDKAWGSWLGKQAQGLEQGARNWDVASKKGAESRARLFGGAGATTPTLPAELANPLAGFRRGAVDLPRAFDPSAISQIEIAGQTLDKQTKAIKGNSDAADHAADVARRWAAEEESLRLQHYLMGESAIRASQNVAGFQIRQSETVAISRDYSKALTQATIHTDSFGTVVARDVTPSLGKMGQGLIDVTDSTVSFSKSVSQYFKSDFGRIIASSIAGGGNPAKAALTGFGQAIFTENSALTKSIAGGVSKVFGSEGMGGKIASQIGSMVPMIGSFIGPAIDGVTALYKKLFGKSEETAKVSPLRDEFFKLQGGIETLNPKVQALGGSLELVQAVFNAKTVEAYNLAIANLNALFQQETDALAVLTETAERYGLTIEELGPAMQRQQLDKQAQQLYKDWQVLNAAGIQTSVITARMSESINKYIQDAVKVGSEIPAAMRPMLESMVQAGQLTDANGNKIDNLENSGISFALTMSDGFKALISSVEKLADVLSRSLGTAIDSTTRKINNIPDSVDVDINYRERGKPKEVGSEVPGYQGGTGGKFVDFGAGTLAMLHGREAIVPASAVANRGVGGSAVGGASVTIQINAQGSFFDTPGDLQRLADKVNDALSAKYGLTNRLRAA